MHTVSVAPTIQLVVSVSVSPTGLSVSHKDQILLIIVIPGVGTEHGTQMPNDNLLSIKDYIRKTREQKHNSHLILVNTKRKKVYLQVLKSSMLPYNLTIIHNYSNFKSIYN